MKNKWFYRSVAAGSFAVFLGVVSFGSAAFGGNPEQNPGNPDGISPTFESLTVEDELEVHGEITNSEGGGVLAISADQIVVDPGSRFWLSGDPHTVDFFYDPATGTSVFMDRAGFNGPIDLNGHATFTGSADFFGDTTIDDLTINGDLNYDWDINTVTLFGPNTNAVRDYSHALACPGDGKLLSCDSTIIQGAQNVGATGTSRLGDVCYGTYRQNVANNVRAFISATCLGS